MKNKNAHAENSAANATTPSATTPDTTTPDSTTSNTTTRAASDQNQYIPEPLEENGQTDNADTLTFSDDVIEKIAGEAAAQAEGVAGLRGGFFNRVQETFGAKTHKGVAVEVEDDGAVALYISIVMRFGYYAPDVFEDVKARVLEAMSQMTGLQIASVNLRIEDIAAPSDTAEKSSEKHTANPANNADNKSILKPTSSTGDGAEE